MSYIISLTEALKSLAGRTASPSGDFFFFTGLLGPALKERGDVKTLQRLSSLTLTSLIKGRRKRSIQVPTKHPRRFDSQLDETEDIAEKP